MTSLQDIPILDYNIVVGDDINAYYEYRYWHHHTGDEQLALQKVLEWKNESR